MERRFWLKVAKGGTIISLGLLGFWNIYQAEAQATAPTDYLLVGKPIEITTQPEAIVPVVVPIKNVSGTSWSSANLRLGTVFSTGDKDRASAWQTADWLSNTRIDLKVSKTIFNYQTVGFNFTMKAPSRAGLYKEYFQPLLGENQWLAGEPVVITINVGDSLQVQSAPEKEVRMYRKTQEGEWLENGYVVATFPISSGKNGYTTPAGRYRIMNHIPDAYSSEYSLWMPYWMGLSNEKYGFRGYGTHALPYWKVNPARYEEGKVYPGGRLYSQGRLYEGYSHLGRPVSHGCVRWGINEARVLYSWAPDGTPVTVV